MWIATDRCVVVGALKQFLSLAVGISVFACPSHVDEPRGCACPFSRTLQILHPKPVILVFLIGTAIVLHLAVLHGLSGTNTFASLWS